MLVTDISFPNAEKEYVSGIELQNGLSVIFFNNYGHGFRLAEVKYRFPFPLAREELADVAIKHVRDFGGGLIKIYATKMIGRTSKKVVMFGTFTVAVV